MNENTLKLLRLLVQSGRLTETRLDALLAGLDLSATRFWALQHLEEADEPLSLGTLAGSMAFARSNATQLVDHLEAEALVRRAAAPQDRRCTHLELTGSGRQRARKALESLRPALEQIEAAFTPQEQEQLAGLLQRLNEAMR